MRIAVYVRVSTQRQAETQTIEQQLNLLLDYLKKDNHKLSQEDIFRDERYSGSTLNRPGLDQLRDKIKAAEYDQVLITTPDRLARHYVHQMVLLEELERYGCAVQFLDRPISQDPHDQLLLQIRGAVAEYERTLISERMRRGRQQKLRSGTMLPWSRPPYGYRVNPDRPRDPEGAYVDPVEAAVIQELFSAYAQESCSLGALARWLHAAGIASPQGHRRWQISSIRSLLTNPTYTGQVYAGRISTRPARQRRSPLQPIGHAHGQAPVPRQHWMAAASVPASITPAQYDLVQEKLSKNRVLSPRNNKSHQYLLRALVSCGVCGMACSARTVQPGPYRYYVCNGKRTSTQTLHEKKCVARSIPVEQLDQVVWDDLQTVVMHPEIVALALERAQSGQWLPHELQARQAALRKGQNSIAQQLERLTAAYLMEVIPLAEYQRRRGELEQKTKALAVQANQLDAQADRQSELIGIAQSIAAFFKRVKAGLSSATFEQKRTLVELLIDRVVVTDGDIELRYVIPTRESSKRVRFCQLRTDYLGGKQVEKPARLLFFIQREPLCGGQPPPTIGLDGDRLHVKKQQHPATG